MSTVRNMPDCPRTRSSSVDDLGRAPARLGQLRRPERQHPEPERRAPAVEQVHAVDPGGPQRRVAPTGRCPTASRIRAAPRASLASSRASRKARTNSRRRRLRGGGELLGGPQPAVELLRLELEPVPEDLVPEDDLQGNEGDVVPVEHGVGKVGGTVTDDGHRRGAPGGPASGAGPACRRPWSSPPGPSAPHR